MRLSETAGQSGQQLQRIRRLFHLSSLLRRMSMAAHVHSGISLGRVQTKERRVGHTGGIWSK